MQKRTMIILFTILFTLLACSNKEIVKEEKTKKEIIHEMEIKLAQVNVDLENKQTEIDKAEVEKVENNSDMLQPKRKKQNVEEINEVEKVKVTVDDKGIIDKKLKTEPMKEETIKEVIKKDIVKSAAKPAVKIKQPLTIKPTEKAPLLSKTSIPTIDFLLPDNNSEERTTTIKNLVVHFTSNAALKPESPYNAQDIRKVFVDYGVSAHYMIGRDGEIYLLVPENRIAYHAGKGNLKSFPQDKDQLNKYSIGIEMMAIGTKEEMSSMMSASVYDSIPQSNIGYTEAQYQALNKLINDIVQRNPDIKKNRKHIVGHEEYAPGRKSDPGSLFNWSQIGL